MRVNMAFEKDSIVKLFESFAPATTTGQAAFLAIDVAIGD